MKKQEWRKMEKDIYLPRKKPQIINVPRFKYFIISGEGNPNTPEFTEHITALYSMSYGIKMNLKKAKTKPKNYSDYTVYPLEGVWSINEEAQKNFTGKINKEDLVFDLMIRQPDFVSKSYFSEILALVKSKKPQVLLNKLRFEKIKEGKCIQMLHIGSYDTEDASFKIMEEFTAQNNLRRESKVHREIYLSDFRKVPTEKLKTVLRFKVI